jgi:hypothetical protein
MSVVGLLLLTALQDAPVELRWRFPAGEERRFRLHQVFDLGGLQLDARDVLALSLKEAQADGVSLVRARYDAVAMTSTGVQKYEYDSEKQRDPGSDPNAKMLATLVGQSFEFRMTPMGEILEVRGFDRLLEGMVRAAGGQQEEALALQLFKQMYTDAVMKTRLQQMSTGLPAAKVKPGEPWENALRLVLPIVGPLKLKGRSTIASLKDGDAVVDQDLRVEGVEMDPNNPLAGLYDIKGKKVSSKSVFSVTRGCSRSVQLDLDLDMTTPGTTVPLKLRFGLELLPK